MAEIYFKVGDTNFNPEDDKYKGIALENTNGVNAAINLGGIILSNNATPENPDPEEKKLLINGKELPTSSTGEEILDEAKEYTDELFSSYENAEGIYQAAKDYADQLFGELEDLDDVEF